MVGEKRFRERVKTGLWLGEGIYGGLGVTGSFFSGAKVEKAGRDFFPPLEPPLGAVFIKYHSAIRFCYLW